MTTFEVRGPDRIDELLALVRRHDAFADLSTDELLLACHERGGAVLAADGIGSVAVAIGRADDGELVASVRLLVTATTIGEEDRVARHALLDAAEEWARERSVARIVVGGGLPFALVPGAPVGSPDVDVAVARGFVVGEQWSSYRVDVSHRPAPPTGVTIRRAVRDEDVALVLVAAAARWPRRSDEIARALDHGTCHVAVTSLDGADVVVGIATHSLARAGWTGPIMVVDDARRRGIGSALLGQVCRDLMIAEFPAVIVGDGSTPEAQAFLQSIGAEPEAHWVALEKRFDDRA